MLHQDGFQIEVAGGFHEVGIALFHQDGGGVVWESASVGMVHGVSSEKCLKICMS